MTRPADPTQPAPETDTPAGDPQEPSPPAEDHTPPDDDTTDDDKGDEKNGKAGSPEAAKYRRRLRDTETERDTLRTQVETLQRSIAETIAAAAGVTGKALWASGTQLDDLLDDDGTVIPEKVTAAAETAITELGLSRRRTPQPNPQQGGSNGPAIANTWGNALKTATSRPS